MDQIKERTFLAKLQSEARKKRIPQNVTFELTYGCNLQCVHCLNPTHRAKPEELRLLEIYRILEEVAEIGVFNVTFSGGELLTRPDLFKILRKARRLGLIITLITNATRMSRAMASRLEAEGVTTVYSSIYGVTKETYESVTGIEGSFERFIQGLKAIKSTSLIGILSMPVLTLNRHEFTAARELAISMAFDFQFTLDIHPRQDGNPAPLAYRLSPQEKIDFTQNDAGIMDLPSSCSDESGFFKCACGKTQFAVSPYGEMNLCIAFPFPKYDLRRGPVRDGWEVLKRTVDEAKPNEYYECPSCELRPYCRENRNDAWLETQDMSVCLPHFYEWAGLEKEIYANRRPLRPTP